MNKSTSESILFKKVKVYDRRSTYHLKRINIRIEHGVITYIGKQEPKAKIVVESKEFGLSPGWFDFGVIGGEPGFEQRETIESLGRAAARGGYTQIAVFPNHEPVIDHASMIEYMATRSAHSDIHIKSIGALTRRTEGKHLAELIDMHKSGAVAFSDGLHAVQSDAVMLKALLYATMTDTCVVNRVWSKELSQGSYVNEGIKSVYLGIKGEPAIAEQILLDRDIRLAQYASARYLAHLISSADSIPIIKGAKKNAPWIKASTSVLHLVASENDIGSYNPHYKIDPPLRHKKDQRALLTACKHGIIDAIVTNHTPVIAEEKNLEFVNAKPGTIGLETSFAELVSFQNILDVETIVHILSQSNRRALDIAIPKIGIGESAELTLFDPKASWIYRPNQIQSMSKNSPYLDKSFIGRVKALYVKGKYISLGETKTKPLWKTNQ